MSIQLQTIALWCFTGRFPARGSVGMRPTNKSAGSDREPADAHAAWQSESTSWHAQASERVCWRLRFWRAARRDTREVLHRRGAVAWGRATRTGRCPGTASDKVLQLKNEGVPS